jgi:hypothetical protein
LESLAATQTAPAPARSESNSASFRTVDRAVVSRIADGFADLEHKVVFTRTYNNDFVYASGFRRVLVPGRDGAQPANFPELHAEIDSLYAKQKEPYL